MHRPTHILPPHFLSILSLPLPPEGGGISVAASLSIPRPSFHDSQPRQSFAGRPDCHWQPRPDGPASAETGIQLGPAHPSLSESGQSRVRKNRIGRDDRDGTVWRERSAARSGVRSSPPARLWRGGVRVDPPHPCPGAPVSKSHLSSSFKFKSVLPGGWIMARPSPRHGPRAARCPRIGHGGFKSGTLRAGPAF